MRTRLGSLQARIARLGDRPFPLGIVTLVVSGVILVAGFSGMVNQLLRRESAHTVKAVFANAQQLSPGLKIRVDGVEAGQVEKITLNRDRRTSTMTMKMFDKAGPLYADAGAILRFRTLLGGAFYVDLERGHSNKGRLNGTIPITRTTRQVEIDDISTALKGGPQKGLQTLPGETAKALADPGAPAHLLNDVGAAAPDLASGLGSLRGQVLDRDLRALVTNTSRTVRALDRPTDALRGTVEGAATTLGVTARRSNDLRAMLRESPATQEEAQVTLRALEGTLRLADPLVADLRRAAPDVRPTFAQLHPTLTDANVLLNRAVPLFDELRPAAASLTGTARRGLPLVNALAPSLKRLDETVLPSLLEVDPGTKKSTAVMIGGTFAGLASGAGGQMDANGHFIRFPATFGQTPANSLPCQVYINNPDAAQIAACKSLNEALKDYLSYSPIGSSPLSSRMRRPRKGNK